MKDREFCTSLRLFITCQKPPLFVKALCSAHTKDYYAVHFKYFVVFLPFDSTSSWMGSPTEKANRKTWWEVYSHSDLHRG